MKLKVPTLALMVLSLFALPVFANHEQGGINIPSLVLDLVLIGGVAVIYFGSIFAGELKTAFNYLFAGIAIFSINHLVETIMLALGVGLNTTEITHRIIHLSGFVFLFYGFYRIKKVCASLKSKG